MSLKNPRGWFSGGVSSIPLIQDRHVRGTRELLGQRKAILSLVCLLIIALSAVFAPMIAPYDPEKPNFGDSFESPNADHPLGTDSFGRDIFSRLLYGARISLWVGLSVVTIAMTFGIPIGLIAGYYSTTSVETVLMRLMDSFLAFPGIILALTLISVLGRNLTNVIIALSITKTPGFARLAHGTVLSIKEEEFITSAKAVGSSDFKIIRRYLLPNALATLIVQATIVFAFAILNEAALSFLGAGTQPPTPSLGLMILEGKTYYNETIWIALFPGLAIMITVLSLNFLGDALRDVLDPRTETDRLD